MARIFDLEQTKGEVKLRGLVTGVEKDSFFKIKNTKSGKQMNILKFGLQTDKENTVYVDMLGMARDNVYFYKRPENKGEKGVTEKVEWNKRKQFNKEGFKILGVNVGLTKYEDENGKIKNKIETLTELDATEVLSENLEDGTSLFIRGEFEFSSFTNDKNEIVRNTKIVPKNILATTGDIDFDKEGFEATSDFVQTIIFMEANTDDSDKSDPKGIITAKVVTYSTIEDVEFVVRNKRLFSTMKKNLKPYNAVQVWGNIVNRAEVEEVVEDDGWGEPNMFDTVNKVYTRELVVLGANPSSVDTDTYSEENVEEAMRLIAESKKAKAEFGSSSNAANTDWGTSTKNDSDDEDLGWD